MAIYKHPGVYLEEIPSGSKPIEQVPTSVTAFVGKIVKGPIGKAELVHRFDEYKAIYGDIASENDTMGFAVKSFFINGGESAYICGISNDSSGAATSNHVKDFYNNTLSKIHDISIIVLPGEYCPKDGTKNPIINATLDHCKKMQNRMVIIDPPPAHRLDQATTVNDLSLPSSSYCALYYPWIKITNPFYDSASRFNSKKNVTVAPSSIAAGIWSRIDNKPNVWKTPAGPEAKIICSLGLQYEVSDNEQNQLNPLGVNCIRNMPTVGSVLWGGRTLATRTNPEWRYISVRRTAIMIKQSISKGTEWAVFEPNDQSIWSTLSVNICNFMEDLFRLGAFQGQKSSDAYFVRCGLGDTMTQNDINNGRIIINIGFAPLKPAEFVIIRIQHQVSNR